MAAIASDPFLAPQPQIVNLSDIDCQSVNDVSVIPGVHWNDNQVFSIKTYIDSKLNGAKIVPRIASKIKADESNTISMLWTDAVVYCVINTGTFDAKDDLRSLLEQEYKNLGGT